MTDLLWMGGLVLAVVVFLIFVRRWSYNIAIDFECDGKIYRAHRDGHFTDGFGARIVDPALVARLASCAEAAKKARFRKMDAQRR
jgi:hypothetical protein